MHLWGQYYPHQLPAQMAQECIPCEFLNTWRLTIVGIKYLCIRLVQTWTLGPE